MSRTHRPAKSRLRGRNSSRQAFVVVMTGAVLAFGAVAVAEFMMVKQDALGLGAAIAKAGGGEIYTGSILYRPDMGNVCRQVLFDNRTGQFTDNGYVDCERAAYHGLDGPKRWSADRVLVISTGFRGD
jgi:hypothetical protein